MSDRERLTRSELSWLLTQEARGAAERLRKGVQILTKPAPDLPMPAKSDRAPGSERPITLTSTGEEGEGLESTLDMLDGAMQKLSQIYGPSTQRGRRGRFDLAALLWEVAPDAKVNLTPGVGTEIYGDENELRRMLHMLLGAASQNVGGAQVVDLKREGDEVKLSVALGPDTAPISPAERGWLARMAIRYGGRYELDGASEILIFPAEDAEQRAEVKELRRELEAAKAQGEAYARELAAVFAEPGNSSRPPPPSAHEAAADAHAFLAPMARISDAVADDLRAILAPLGAAKIKAQNAGTPENDPSSALLREVHESLVKGAELLALTRQIARVGGDINRIPVDLALLARDEASLATVAFASRGVVLTIAIGPEGGLELDGMPSALRALVAEMLDRALRGSEPGSEVRIAVDLEEGRRALVVEGVGEGSESAVRSLREGGRAALVFLTEIARAHRIELRVDDARLIASLPDRPVGA
jgi:two-component system OmpR family sensor kinase